MRILTSFGIGLALVLFTISNASADCTYDEAEGLNTRIMSTGYIAKSRGDWTPESSDRLRGLKQELNEVNNQHIAAVEAKDQNSLNAVCEKYRAILAEIDELAKQAEKTNAIE